MYSSLKHFQLISRLLLEAVERPPLGSRSYRHSVPRTAGTKHAAPIAFLRLCQLHSLASQQPNLQLRGPELAPDAQSLGEFGVHAGLEASG